MNGLYSMKVPSSKWTSSLYYAVDTQTQLCFASTTLNTTEARERTLILVPCENLARRPGWEDIITWIDPAPATE